ncbi:MAG TPA: radical SAM protein, partial [Polyangiaceae bacterium]
MGIPITQQIILGKYLLKKKLLREKKFPLLVEIEPLFACNLECAGCGKIQYPPEILKKRLSVEQVLAAMEECGAPMVSIAGGEPLIHPEIDVMVKKLLERGIIVFLCTNALLLEKKMHLFEPHPRFSWTVHIDGLR